MSDKITRLAKDLEPFLVKLIHQGVGGGGGGSVAMATHPLASDWHSGALSDAQGPQFLKTDGSRMLVGNLSVGAGYTVDGVDISAHAQDPAAHHAPVTAGDGIALAGQQVAVSLYVAASGLKFVVGGLAVNPGNGVEVVSDLVRVDEDASFIWAGVHQFGQDPQVNANLDFIGAADREITAAQSIILAPATNIVLKPTSGVAELFTGKTVRATTHSDLVTGITGFSLFDRGSNQYQLSAFAGKFDELYARVFVADEVRLDRGEEYWSKSYGIVESDFVIPADEATVDVWFEEAPALGTAKIFTPGDWLQCRVIDWTTGIDMQTIWWEVVDAGALDYIQRADQTGSTPDRQQWRIRRKVGGTTGKTIRKGSVFLDAGIVGQGWVHLSALAQDNGPFLQMGSQTAAGTTTAAPVFTNYVRMGNLKGVGGISGDTWGFAAAKNLGTTIGSGYEGMVLDSDNGLRIYNAAIELHYGGTQTVGISAGGGIWLRTATDASGLGGNRSIYWIDGTGYYTGGILSHVGDGYRNIEMRAVNQSTGTARAILSADNSSAGPRLHVMRSGGVNTITNFGTDTVWWAANSNVLLQVPDNGVIRVSGGTTGSLFVIGTTRTIAQSLVGIGTYAEDTLTYPLTIQHNTSPYIEFRRAFVTSGYLGAVSAGGLFSGAAAYDMALRADGSNSLWLGSAGAGELHLVTNNTRRIAIMADGKVGIGNAAPAYALDTMGGRVRGTLAAKSTGTVGYVAIASGDATYTGLISWHLPAADGSAGTRLGYMGYHASDVALILENGAKFFVGGSAYINNNLTVAGNFGTWTEPGSFGTGWTNLDSANYTEASYRKIGDVVQLRGVVKRTSGSGVVIFTLPSGYRPVSGQRCVNASVSNGAACRVDVLPAGDVRWEGGGDASAYVSLDNIQFSTI